MSEPATYRDGVGLPRCEQCLKPLLSWEAIEIIRTSLHKIAAADGSLSMVQAKALADEALAQIGKRP